MNKLTVVALMLMLLVGYQNCANSLSFQPGQELVQKVDRALEDSNTYDGVIEEVAEGMPDSTRPVVRDPVAGYPPRDQRHEEHEDDEDDNHNHDEIKISDDHKVYEDPASKAQIYVCVLKGKGRSVRLGMTGAGLSHDTATINDVCMTRKACEQFVSKAFEVKGAERRGYCGQNNRRDIVHLSDNQVEEAVSGELLKRLMITN
jgi:hypothetical protein